MCRFNDNTSKEQRKDGESPFLFTGEITCLGTGDELQKEKTTKELEMFKELLDNGIITSEWLSEKAENMKKKKEQEILNNHPYSVYEYKGYWYTTVPDIVKGRRKIKKKNKQDLEQAIIDYYSSNPDDHGPTVKEVFKEWNEKRLADGYVKGATALRDMRTFEKYIMNSSLYDRPVRLISREEWTVFLQDNLPGKTAKEFGRLKGVVKGILQYAEDHLLICYSDDDVIRKVRAPKNSFLRPKKNPENEIYFPDELKALRQYCVDHPNPYTRCILLETIVGERPGELCPIMVEDINLENMQIYIRRTESRDYVNGKQKDVVHEGAKTETGLRRISIPETAREFVEELVRIAEESGGGYLFKQEPGHFKKRYVGNRIRSRQLRRHLKEICEAIGITYKPPHKLRKTYASILRENEIDDQTITDMMGHVDIKVTEQFYLRSRTRASERSRKLGQIIELQLPKSSDTSNSCKKS